MKQANNSLYSQLYDGLTALSLDTSFSHALLDYLDLLVRWNKAYNLTAIRNPNEMLTKHLLDSLAMHPYFTQDNLADLGTGAGLPGIPLAIIRPEAQISLIESNGKKTRFLREVVRQLALKNVTVIESRAESVDQPEQFQSITARAMDRLAGILKVGGHLLNRNGVLLAMKGPQINDEIADLPNEWHVKACHTLHVPGLLAKRQLVIVGRKDVC